MRKFWEKLKKNKARIIPCVLLTLLLMQNAFIFYNQSEKEPVPSTKEIDYSQFLKNLEEGVFSEITISTNQITAVSQDESGEEIEYHINRVKDDELVNRLQKSGVEFRQKKDTFQNALNLILNLLPLVLIIWISYSFMGKTVNAGNSIKKYTTDSKEQIKFADIAGEEEAKESLMEIVDILHNPKKYTTAGAKLPKGVLLVGPPGTGKTLIAKAVAGEADVPFYSMAGSEFVEMFVGLGAKRVRQLFKTASQNAPCIVFIDEIDAMAQSRSSKTGRNSENDQTLNQLLTEMDGFESSKGVIVIAATNRPESLDKALLRPGRFDRQVVVERPDLDGRIEIFKVHAKNLKLADDVDFKEIALMTTGATGAEIANIVNESAILTAKENALLTTQKHFLEAAETVLTGKEKKSRILTEKEKSIVAHHEVGHALVTAILKNTEPVQKITIIPRTNGALGYVLQTPEEEKYIYQKSELENKLTILLGGQAAEEVFFGETSTGAANDLERATALAKSYVAQYGMSKIGSIGFLNPSHQYLDGMSQLNCGKEMEAEIDYYTVNLLNESYAQAKSIIEKYKNQAKKIATYLEKTETITGKEFLKMLEKT